MLDPHLLQKPRRALSDDSYQLSERALTKFKFSFDTCVAAQKCPEVLRHCEQ